MGQSVSKVIWYKKERATLKTSQNSDQALLSTGDSLIYVLQ